MKKIIPLLVMPLVLSLINGCTTGSSNESTSTTSLLNKGSVQQGNISVFPKQENGYIGDPMPFFDNGKMNVFYLHDARDGKKGFHPFYLMQTDDYLNWEDKGEVIPYVNDYSSQDLALGTGSIIKDKEGLYHAFYTGHNSTGNMPLYEKIQHATSTDMINWTKIAEHGFFGGTNDFRDPYVLYMEDEGLYWMLITTRVNHRGVIKLYKSSNLISWSDNGVFFNNDAGTWNMECPTLIKFNDYWYLSYSEQGSNRIVHYRYTRNLDNGWTRPSVDYFDGIGFYAGRIEKVNNRLFAFGWVGTKQYDFDGGEFNWAGNLVSHELVQLSNGELKPRLIKEVDEKLATRVKYNVSNKSKVVKYENDNIKFDARSGYDYVLFEELEAKPTKLTFSAKINGEADKFGLTFSTNDDVYGSVNVVFNVEDNKLEFYNVTPFNFSKTVPQISIDYNMDINDILNVNVLIEGQCLSMYINDEIALTTRMYNMSNNPFGLFAMKSDIELENVHFFE